VSSSLIGLNSEQRKAVNIARGPILILAGAGSGKTRVITYRIAYLISESGVKPKNILAVTFTNKAADEMKTRIYSLLAIVPNDDQGIWIRTYHSSCAKILRGASNRIGISRNFSIYDESDQLSVIKECLKELDINSKELKPDFVLGMISRAKENLISPQEYDPNLPAHLKSVIRSLYVLYDKKLSEYGALDFDDLIFKTVSLFQSDTSVLGYYQDRFQYILVDEYQDTNRAQYVFTNLLAAKHRNLCVVGDDDQSIYSWRGAEIRNILDFEKDYPDAAVIKLEQNYRSTQNILKAASEVVRNNKQRKDKVLWSDSDAGEKIEFFEADDDNNEAAYVVRKVLELKLSDQALGGIAVFYRLNYQSRIFEEFFVKHKIPYEVVGALKFYERAEIKNILAYLRVVNNPRDGVSLKRIINLPLRNIGKESIEKVVQYQAQNHISFFDALKAADSVPGIALKTRHSIKDFVALMEMFLKLRMQLNLYELTMRVARESGYVDSLNRGQTEEEFNRRKNVEQLLISINDYIKTNPQATLEEYLESVSLRNNIDDWRGDSNRVSLMTLHNAKGLEFDTVFITGLEDGIIPHYKSVEENRYEEERRLMYVGITRARKKLFLTAAAQRETYRGGYMFTRISPFVEEIPSSVFATTYERSRQER
jgi:DNA helicase-2/ATP-dependent DNA helicase PcrA